jgi:hypothetical protein
MRVTGNLFFQPNQIFRGPTKGVNPKNSEISKLLKYYVVGTLNLCQELTEPMQKESAQSDHCAGRKRSKRADILGYLGICPNQQYPTTFSTFSLAREIGLS